MYDMPAIPKKRGRHSVLSVSRPCAWGATMLRIGLFLANRVAAHELVYATCGIYKFLFAGEEGV